MFTKLFILNLVIVATLPLMLRESLSFFNEHGTQKELKLIKNNYKQAMELLGALINAIKN